MNYFCFISVLGLFVLNLCFCSPKFDEVKKRSKFLNSVFVVVVVVVVRISDVVASCNVQADRHIHGSFVPRRTAVSYVKPRIIQNAIYNVI